jgi:hypothetical protein
MPFLTLSIKYFLIQIGIAIMKHLSILITCLLCAGIGYSQTIQIQAGTTISSLNWRLGSLYQFFDKPMIGYAVFAGLHYVDKKYYNLSSNIGLVRKGGQDKRNITDLMGNIEGSETIKASIDYISFNSTIDVKYPIYQRYIPYLSIGPRFDYLVSSNDHLDGVEEVEGFNKTSYGLLFGAGIKYSLSPILIGLKAEYYHNFNKIAEWPAQNGNLGGSISDQTMTLCLTLGYKLG